MTKEEFENLLNELNSADVEHSRKTEIFQEMRTGVNNLYQERNEFEESRDKLQRDNDDLVLSNSKLFRQAGILDQEEEQEVDKKEFSETVTLEELEGSF